jgi:CBS domain-containing protein
MITTVRQLLDEKGHNVITVGADDTVFDAVRKMAEENIGSLIVCEGSKVIGLITERHYARNVFLEGRALPNTRVGDVMETPVLFVRPGLTAEECMAVMTEKRVRYLPVIDEGKLIGIISIGDLVKNIISNHQFTIDQLTDYLHARGAKYRGTQRPQVWHRYFASVGVSRMTRPMHETG